MSFTGCLRERIRAAERTSYTVTGRFKFFTALHARMEGGLCVHNVGVEYTVRYPGGVSGSFLFFFFPSVVRRVNGWSVLRSPVNLFILEELQAPMKI